jgi:hypothetical protein
MIDAMIISNPVDQDAFLLLTVLRRYHWNRDFKLANATHETLGWTLQRFKAARKRLIKIGRVMVVRHATRTEPMICGLEARK